MACSNRGKASSAGAGRQSGGRPWEKQSMDVLGSAQYHLPFGMVSPVQQVGMLTRRHMHDFGTKAEHLELQNLQKIISEVAGFNLD